MLGERSTLRCVFFAHGLLFASWAAHIPQVKRMLGLSDGSLGLVLLATPLGSVSAMLAGAVILRRVGSRRMVGVCLAGICVSGPFVGLATSWVGLFIALLCWGAFQGTLDVAMNTQAVDQERAAGQPIMSGLHAQWSLGALTGAGVGALAVWAGISLTVQLIVLGALALMVVPLTRSLLDDPSAPVGQRRSDEGRRLPHFTNVVALLAAVAFATMLCEGAAADWSAVYLRDSVGAAPVIASLGYACFVLAMVVVRLGGDRLLVRYAPGKLLPALALVATVGYGSALLSGSSVAMLFGLATLGAGLAAVVPTVFGAAGTLPGIPTGTGIATVSAFGWAGYVFGPPIIGQLASVTSLPVALGVLPLLTAFIAVATARFWRRASPVQPVSLEQLSEY